MAPGTLFVAFCTKTMGNWRPMSRTRASWMSLTAWSQRSEPILKWRTSPQTSHWYGNQTSRNQWQFCAGPPCWGGGGPAQWPSSCPWALECSHWTWPWPQGKTLTGCRWEPGLSPTSGAQAPIRSKRSNGPNRPQTLQSEIWEGMQISGPLGLSTWENCVMISDKPWRYITGEDRYMGGATM